MRAGPSIALRPPPACQRASEGGRCVASGSKTSRAPLYPVRRLEATRRADGCLLPRSSFGDKHEPRGRRGRSRAAARTSNADRRALGADHQDRPRGEVQHQPDAVAGETDVRREAPRLLERHRRETVRRCAERLRRGFHGDDDGEMGGQVARSCRHRGCRGAETPAGRVKVVLGPVVGLRVPPPTGEALQKIVSDEPLSVAVKTSASGPPPGGSVDAPALMVRVGSLGPIGWRGPPRVTPRPHPSENSIRATRAVARRAFGLDVQNPTEATPGSPKGREQ